MSLVGGRVRPIDWEAKTSGASRFTLDAIPPGSLFAAVLRSPHPHARIVSLDTSRARALPGVHAVITAADFAEDARYFAELPFGDRRPLARDIVRFIGEEVAAVAAETPEIAEAAVRAITVRYRRLRAPLSTADALRSSARSLHDRGTGERNVSVRNQGMRGDLERAVSASGTSAKGTYVYPRVAQAPMEPSACIASWDRTREMLELWTTTQVPLIITEAVADMLGLERRQVVCREVAVGGGFGSRSQACEYEALTAMLSLRACRPVVTAFSREEEFSYSRTRHAIETTMVGHADADGRIRAFDAQIVMDNGAYNMTGPIVLSVGLHGLSGMYQIDAARWDGRVVDTAIVPGGQMRGLGYPQIALASESIVDELAERQGADPLEYRIRNANFGGQRTVSGAEIGSADLVRCLQLAGDAIGWVDKRARHVPFRGVGVAAGMHGSGDNGGRADANRSDAAIDLYSDGHARVRYGSIDCGTHQRTVIAQIVADELGIRLVDVEVLQADTEQTPFELGQWGSRGTYFSGHAVRKAAVELADQLRQVARNKLGAASVVLAEGLARGENGSVTIGELANRAPGSRDGCLTHESSYVDPIIRFDPESAEVDDVSGTYTFAAHAVEVEVDPDTGQFRIVDYVAAHDVGRALNPSACEGQIIGGAVMGLGAVRGEQLIHQDGRVVNPAYLSYALPRAADVPRIRPILVEGAIDNGPYGAKSVGEMPTVLVAPAILNALYDATGIRFRELPVTPDKILAALRAQQARPRRQHQLPGRWQIELMRRAYPYGVHALLHRFGRKVAQRAQPREVESVQAPQSVAELVVGLGRDAAVLGGGTDLQLQRRQGIARPARLVSVQAVEEIRHVSAASDGALEIGAAVTLEELLEDERTPPVIQDAVRTIASQQIRTVATVGGNLVQAKRCWFFRNGFDCYKRAGVTAPCYAVTGDHRFYHAAMQAHRCQAVTPSDLATALVALDAVVMLASAGYERSVAIADFYSGPGETVLREGEAVRAVRIPSAARARAASFEKLGLWTGDFAVTSVAISVARDASGTSGDARIVFGALAPTPWRARAAEAVVNHSGMDVDRVLEALDRELDHNGHPLERNAWKFDAARGLAKQTLQRLVVAQTAGGVAQQLLDADRQPAAAVSRPGAPPKTAPA